MKWFQWKWIFTESKSCCTIWLPFWFAMVAILNPKWPPKYKNPPIWAKFGFQVDYDVANWYPLFGSHVMILQIISYLVIILTSHVLGIPVCCGSVNPVCCGSVNPVCCGSVNPLCCGSVNPVCCGFFWIRYSSLHIWLPLLFGKSCLIRKMVIASLEGEN